VLNAANEVAVAAFLDKKLSFYGIVETVLEAVDTLKSASKAKTLEDILEFDSAARELTSKIISSRKTF